MNWINLIHFNNVIRNIINSKPYIHFLILAPLCDSYYQRINLESNLLCN